MRKSILSKKSRDEAEYYGHADGRSRCGVYVMGEEYDIAEERAYVLGVKAKGTPRDVATYLAWLTTYQIAYRRGASGE